MPVTRKPGKARRVSSTPGKLVATYPASEAEAAAALAEALDPLVGKRIGSPLGAAEAWSLDTLKLAKLEILDALQADELSPEWYAGRILRALRSLRINAARGDLADALDEAATAGWLFREALANEHPIAARGERDLDTRRAGGRRAAEDREERAGRAGWRVRALPVYSEAVSRGLTVRQTVDAIYRVERGRVGKKTIANQVSAWRNPPKK